MKNTSTGLVGERTGMALHLLNSIGGRGMGCWELAETDGQLKATEKVGRVTWLYNQDIEQESQYHLEGTLKIRFHCLMWFIVLISLCSRLMTV